MSRRSMLTTLVGLLTGFRAHAEQVGDEFPQLWQEFSVHMNNYVSGLNGGLMRSDELRRGVKAWDRMQRKMGWRTLL